MTTIALSLADVAALARVQRPVVTMWRKREKDGVAFPAPRPDGRFEGMEIVDWLERTGRGNNPDLRAELAVHAVTTARQDPRRLTELLVLLAARTLLDEPLSSLDHEDLLDAVDALDPDDEFLFGEVERLDEATLPQLTAQADAVADAAWHPRAAYERLHDALQRGSAGHDDRLDPELAAALAAVARGVIGVNGSLVDVEGSCADVVLALTADEDFPTPALVLPRSSAPVRDVLRRYRTQGIRPRVVPLADAWSVPAGSVTLVRLPDDQEIAFDLLREVSVQLPDAACALVVGPAGFVQAEKFLAAHDEDPSNLSVYGQELNESTWRMAKMNLAIHGLNGNLAATWGDTFSLDYHAGVQMDYVMANPPFNIKDWNRKEEDARWVYGVPPAGNANYAWLQHIISKLAPGGTAGVVLANGSMTTNSGGEGEIRAQLVENDLVACMIALPEKLFRSTGIPVCLWFFAKDKGAGKGGSVDRRGQVLFIDARSMGHMVTRAERAFSSADIHKIADTYHAWRGMQRLPLGTVDVTEPFSEERGTPASPEERGTSVSKWTYADVPGFCKSATLAEIKEAGYALTPGRYVGMAEAEDDGEPLDEKIARLTAELEEQFRESDRLQAVVRQQFGRL